MTRIFLALIALLLAQPASALSCLRPDIVSIFEQARDAKEGFWIVKGRITADSPIAIPQPNANGLHKDNAKATTPVQITGLGLVSNGSYRPFVQKVSLSITCVAHWCGSVKLDQEQFMAIEVTEDGPELVVDACGSRLAPATLEGEQRLMRCLRDNVCERGSPEP